MKLNNDVKVGVLVGMFLIQSEQARKIFNVLQAKWNIPMEQVCDKDLVHELESEFGA